MKDKDLGAAFQVARDPITGLPHGMGWPNLVAEWPFRDGRVRDGSGAQPAFDGRQQRHLQEQSMTADLLLNRPRQPPFWPKPSRRVRSRLSALATIWVLVA